MANLDGIDAVLLDLDGVLYVEGGLLPGADVAVKRLRGAGMALRFVTNTTANSRSQTLEKLRGFGIELDEDELVTPAALARRHCEDAGHRIVALIMNDDVKADFGGLEEADTDVDAVIMGDLGEQFGFRILNQAFRLVMDGAELIALQKNRFWLTADGLSLDAGPFVAAIEYATGKDAFVVGKPSVGFFDIVLADLGADRDSVAMVGDDVETDIGGALDAGIAAVLVRTGKYREDFVRDSGIEPTATIDSVAELPELLGS
ncbi:MAG TPA: TIGR01458 family HAD-type hydrolase [Solirubrobacterales bacterium]|jgi:HAD superfamily hydrolase (TIGR01458 family)